MLDLSKQTPVRRSFKRLWSVIEIVAVSALVHLALMAVAR